MGSENPAQLIASKAPTGSRTDTYARIQNTIPHQIPILMQPMMRLPESNTRTTARDRTRINRIKAAKERRGPRCRSGWVGDARGVFGRGGGAGNPAVEISLHFRFWGGVG